MDPIKPEKYNSNINKDWFHRHKLLLAAIVFVIVGAGILVQAKIYYYRHHRWVELPIHRELKPADDFVSVQSKGGFCVSAAACEKKFAISSDGKAFYDDVVKGVLSSSEQDKLANLIAKSDFEKIKGKAFTGTCPTAYDGQEFVYSVSYADSTHVMSTCESNLEAVPVIDYISELREKYAFTENDGN